MEQEQGAKGRYTCNKPQWRRHSLSVAQAKPLAIDTAGQDLVLVMMAGSEQARQALRAVPYKACTVACPPGTIKYSYGLRVTVTTSTRGTFLLSSGTAGSLFVQLEHGGIYDI